LAGCGFGWRCQQNSDYQPVGLRFASLPALSSLNQKRNLISLPVLKNHQMKINLTKGDEKVIINSQKTLFGGAKKTEKIIGT
jgi:hypothetical protein